MASPYVAGVVAHLQNRFPEATTGQIRDALEKTARHPDPLITRDDDYGHGIVEPLAAVAQLRVALEALTARPSTSLASVVSVSASGENTCALLASGSAECWGDNRDGRSVVPEARFLSLSASRDISTPGTGGHVCGLLDDGRRTADSRGLARCWGFGTTDNPTEFSARGTFTQVTAGRTFSCGLRPDTIPRRTGEQRSGGHAVCWDHLPPGEQFADRRSEPPSDTLFVHLSAGWHHGCGATAEGFVECWGSNDDGQSDPPLLLGVEQVASGRYHSCALLDTKEVECWGESRRNARYITGATDPPRDNFIAISAHRNITCGITVDRYVICWGDDTYGQVSDVPYESGFLNVSAGDDHVCAVKGLNSYRGGIPVGHVVCWGRNDLDQVAPPIAGRLTHLSVLCRSTPCTTGKQLIRSFKPFVNTYQAEVAATQDYVTVVAQSFPGIAPSSTPIVQPDDSRHNIPGHQVDIEPNGATRIVIRVQHPYATRSIQANLGSSYTDHVYTVLLNRLP